MGRAAAPPPVVTPLLTVIATILINQLKTWSTVIEHVFLLYVIIIVMPITKIFPDFIHFQLYFWTKFITIKLEKYQPKKRIRSIKKVSEGIYPDR